MKGRLFSPEIRSSKNFAQLTFRQRDLFHGIIEKCADDQGRLIADAAVIRAAVWTWDEITIAETQAEIGYLASGKHPFLLIYEIDEKSYIQIISWWKWQKSMNWAAASLYPASAGWVDRVKIQTTGNKTLMQNWDLAGGFCKVVDSGQHTEVDSGVDSGVDTGQDTHLDTPVVNVNVNVIKENIKVKENESEVNLKQVDEKIKTAWDLSLGDLQSAMGRADFSTYMQNLHLVTVSKSTLRVRAMNRFVVDWLNRRVKTTIEKNLRGYLADPGVLVEFYVDDLRTVVPIDSS